MLHPQIIYTDERARGKQLHRGSLQAAGYDVCVFPEGADEVTIQPGETQLIKTGMRVWIGTEGGDYFGMVVPRSSVGHKLGIQLGNTTGIIDADYQGEIMLSLHNRNSTQPVRLLAGDRVAQMIFVPYGVAIIHECETFAATTNRGSGGYGSTGR